MMPRPRRRSRRHDMLEQMPEPEPYVPWEVKGYKEASKVIRDVWALHSRVRIGGSFGCGDLGDTFWCEGCNQQWPCKTARLVIDWGQLGQHEYEPLRLIEANIQRHPEADKIANLNHSEMQAFDPTITGSRTKASDPERTVLFHSDGRKTWVPRRGVAA